MKQLLARLMFLVPLYTLLRVGFFFYHLSDYSSLSTEKILLSFVLGLRFDFAAIFWTSAPLIFLSIIPLQSKHLETLKSILFTITTTLITLMSLDDYELVQFMGKRLSKDLFVISDDIWLQLPQLTLYYWYFPLIALLIGVGIWKIDQKYFKEMKGPKGLVKHALISLLVLSATVLAIRGGWQKKPLSVQSAFTQGEHELGVLVLNTPYHFLRTFKNEPLRPLQFMSAEDVQQTLSTQTSDYKGVKNANIVILILESFSSEYLENGYMPFLNSLKEKSLFFPHHLANGRRSIEALPAIFNSLPSLLSEPISKSNFQSNHFYGLGHALKDAGYTNYFFHGGFRGTMSFDAYVLSNGFDKYFAKEDYPDQKDFDGNWGIYDGPFLKYSLDIIEQMPKPFMVGLFTLSSHQPYAIPEQWKGKFPKGNLEIHESIGYVDEMLKIYFEEASKKDWFKDTIFIITADHTQKLEKTKFNNTVGRYRVPLIIYAPERSWGAVDTTQVSQHTDIPKTILDYVEVDSGKLPLLGRSLFSGNGFAVYRENAEYGLLDGNKHYRLLDGVGTLAEYNWETGAESEQKPDEAKRLRAYLQYYFNGLINNSLSSEKIVTE
jgi:phosphoglycerol transferase MdoB-like AlkP superfamily enzyme